MRTFDQGDVVRVPFPYTDRSTRQFRPALVVSKSLPAEGATLLWVVMITSAENRSWPEDLPIGSEETSTGLPVPSTIRPCKIATIDADSAKRLGHISSALMEFVRASLRRHTG